MPLVDLAQITLERTFAGICCPSCSGRLEVDTGPEPLWTRLTQRSCKPRIRYRCMNCRKRYVLTQTGL